MQALTVDLAELHVQPTSPDGPRQTMYLVPSAAAISAQTPRSYGWGDFFAELAVEAAKVGTGVLVGYSIARMQARTEIECVRQQERLSGRIEMLPQLWAKDAALRQKDGEIARLRDELARSEQRATERSGEALLRALDLSLEPFATKTEIERLQRIVENQAKTIDRLTVPLELEQDEPH